MQYYIPPAPKEVPAVKVQTIKNKNGYLVATFSRPFSYEKPECAKDHPNEVTFHPGGVTMGGYSLEEIIRHAKENDKNVLVFGKGICCQLPDVEQLYHVTEVE